ncbi:MAG: PEP-CTERM sorting domain-containing protein [Planctomycetaceae bacterium]|nr:PEP-CTERM sorting domain-containing protein [Planctomycetaceae bacterium]
MKSLAIACVVCICALGLPCMATIVLEASGTSAKGVEVEFRAEMAISGDQLTITLINNSPVYSLNPDDLLGSFYFDIVNPQGVRPALDYVSAIGDIYLASQKNPDTLVQSAGDIMAEKAGDYSWMFATLDQMVNPYLAFGLGTVGNNNLTPNNFSGNIVDGVDYAIYKGEITTRNLDGKLLVKNQGVFVFNGLTGFSESDISRNFAFGLGTAPDSLLTPEPATLAILGLGAAAMLLKRKSL